MADAENSGGFAFPNPLYVSQHSDAYLDVLVGVANADPRCRIGITLVLSGAVVHGDLVSQERWKVAWREVALGARGAGQEQIAGLFDQFDKAIEAEHGDELPEWSRGYIHLLDATVVAGPPSARFPMWRGQLSAVSGWSLGRLPS